MPLRLSFNLGDQDLQHFEEVAQQTQAIARAQPADAIVARAREVLEHGSQSQGAAFVKERYSRLQAMIEMVSDDEWRLEADDRQRVINALACFSVRTAESSPTSLLDHAIMIELVSRDLQHDLNAYREFSRFRESHDRKRRKAAPSAREEAMQKRRELLQTRMHERRKRDLEKAGSSVRRLFSLFGL
jgi:oligoendopeptidase F